MVSRGIMARGAAIRTVQRRGATLAGAVFCAFGAPTTAAAHAPFPGVGAFWNGALHPLLAPSHLFALLAAGLLLGQHAPGLSRWGLPLTVSALAAALTAPATGAANQTALIAAAGAAGLLVALNRPIAVPILFLLAAIGTLVGLDADQGDLLAPPTAAGAMGMLFGAALIVTIAGGLAAALSGPWQRIALRASGSWIAAIALMVLALEVAPTGALP